MNIRRRIPQLLIAAALFINASAHAGNEIATYARYQKDRLNEYKKYEGFTLVWVGFDEDEAFEIYKEIPQSDKITHVFVPQFVGAKDKTVVVGNNGVRALDISTNHVENIKNITNPKAPTTSPTTTVFPQNQGFQLGVSFQNCRGST